MSKSASFRSKTSKALSHVYDLTVDLAESNEGTRSGMAAGTAASLLSIGIDKMNASSAEVENMDSPGNSSTTDDSTNDATKKEHFIDKLLERLLVHAMPSDTPGREFIGERISDSGKSKKPNLSISILANNFKTLAGRMQAAFVIRFWLVKVITWKKPSITLTFLMLYTYLCLYPHLVLIYPVLLVIFGIMLPGYEYRHPLPRPDIYPVNKRGQSLLEFFSKPSDLSIFHDFVDEDKFQTVQDRNELSPISTNSSDTIDDVLLASNKAKKDKPKVVDDGYESESESDLTKKRKKKAVQLRDQMELLINMRDLQNLTTDLLKVGEAFDKFWYETAGFKDERTSTSMFFSLLMVVLFVLFFGAYTPWRAIFILGGWGLIILCHPNSASYIKSFNTHFIKPREKEWGKKMAKTEREDIVLDEPPEIREVEIFELEQRGTTTANWTPYCFTNSVFEKKDSIRQAQKVPQGVSSLEEVLPPKGWHFEFDSEDSWSVDHLASRFVEDRSLTDLSVDDKNEWIYDNFIVRNGIEFRRRRWVRNSYRYSRQARKPKDQNTEKEEKDNVANEL